MMNNMFVSVAQAISIIFLAIGVIIQSDEIVSLEEEVEEIREMIDTVERSKRECEG